MRTCGQTRSAEPNAPPTNGDRTRTSSLRMPNASATWSCTLSTHCVLSWSVSRGPSQTATVACISIGLWYSAGWVYVASTFTSAAASAFSGSPRW